MMDVKSFVDSWGIILVILSHAGGTIWWMSKVNTTLTFIREDFKSLDEDIKKKDSQVTTIWSKIDNINARLSAVEAIQSKGDNK